MSVRITALLAAVALTAIPQMASANTATKEALAACVEQVRTELPVAAEEVAVNFKRIKGSSRVKTLKLKVSAGDVTGLATCKVRRGETPVITFDKKLETERAELVKRAVKPATQSGAN